MKKPLIILTGPTAVGKTKLSVSLAKKIDGEIISADSMQVYKYMDIGSAKIKQGEMEGIPHYLIDQFMPEEEFHVVKFKEYSEKHMAEIYDKGKIPMIVGGTGFYIQSVLYDIDFTETEKNSELRQELETLAEQKGASYLHRLLAEVDPGSAKTIHENNVKRVIRALEYYKETGSPISGHNEEQRKKESPFNFIYLVLNKDRELLYQGINQRVDHMLEEGLIEEVKRLKDMGYNRTMVAMQGLGYKEILSYLDGEYSLEEAVYQIKRDTRHFAKRQLTWFKREKDVTWIEVNPSISSIESLTEEIIIMCREKGIIS